MKKAASFRTIFDSLCIDLGVDRAEMLRDCGLSPWAYYKWRDGAVPRPEHLGMMEYRHKFTFTRDGAGVIAGYVFNASEAIAGEPGAAYAADRDIRHAASVIDITATPLREMLTRLREAYAPHTTGTGERMEKDQAEVYEAMYRTMMRDVESVVDEALTLMRKRLREFENELDRRNIEVIATRQAQGDAPT